jgi:photosystem II stability/assembly factor-like uncharacterized protein
MKTRITVLTVLTLAVALAFAISPVQMAPRTPWRILGPGGGGAQYRPTVSPHDPNTVLLTTDMTGGFITRDAGRRWRRFNLRTGILSYAFDPSNPKVMYAGETGVYRSEDGGEKWRLVFPDAAKLEGERNLGDEAGHFYFSRDNWPAGKAGDLRYYTVPEIRIDPQQPESIFVAVVGRPYLSSRDYRLLIFHSADRARAWRQILDLPGKDLNKLYIDPSSPADRRRIFVATGTGLYVLSAPDFRLQALALPAGVSQVNDFGGATRPGSSSPVLYLTSPAKREEGRLDAGVYRSSDQGRTWSTIQTGLVETVAPGGLPEFTFLAPAEKNASVVYLAVKAHPEVNGQSYYGVVKTEDSGDTWRWVVKASNDLNPANKKVSWVARDYSPEWGEYPLGIGADTSGRICYVSDFGTTYRTLDGGKSWEEVYADDHPDGSVSSRGIDLTSSYGVHFDPFDPKHIAISYTDVGLFHSYNSGRSWFHSLKGVPRGWWNTCYWVVFDPEAKDRAWSVWADRHDLPRGKMLRDYKTEGYPGGICRSDDGLKTWQVSSDGLPPQTVATHIVLEPGSPKGKRTLYVAAFRAGVYKSTDDGRSWKLKNHGISGNLNAWRLALAPDRTMYLIVPRDLQQGQDVDGVLYRSRDRAEHWERMPLPAGATSPNDLVFDPAAPSRMYLACWPKTENGVEQGGGIYITADGGRSWTRTFDESVHTYGLAVDPSRPQTLFAVTYENSAYRSDDRGRTWRRLGGYDFKLGNRPFPDPNEKGMLYITTYGSSVWHGRADGISDAFEALYPPVK